MTLVSEQTASATISQPVAFTRRRPVPGISERGPDLLPLEPGEQYRFTFAMDACVGCHSCEVACAEQNDTPVDAQWRRVGELEGGSFPDTRRFSLSMACNHCLEPTCLAGCPTNAYEKLANGIVVHHPDECVGCEYCIWNCPYEVPVFNKAKRIVSKCDMCRPRIEEGQSPACVLACPTKAIGVEPVSTEAWRLDHRGADAPGLPPSDITVSTTRITVPAGVADDEQMVPANAHRIRPEKPHWPLIFLTLLTQLSLGTLAATVLLDLVRAGSGTLAGAARAAFVAGAVALAASLLHLGRPERALKALRNLKTSWLSREVALFSAFSLLSFAYAALPVPPIGVAAVALGAAGVYASARLYLVPARPVWNSRRTPVAFFATAAATGPVLALLSLDRGQLTPAWIAVLLAVATAGCLAQVAVQIQLLAALKGKADVQHRGTADLLRGRFRMLLTGRVAAAAAAVLFLTSTFEVPLAAPAAGGRLVGALFVIGLGELAGRYLFYVTVVPYRVAGSFFTSR
ncbi:MAG: dimethyl sulfoxide reductase anchor subunit [Actinomycetota bacterium]|nr:dimethyl sulfoxide reductase anchor subunit [Actinomycetota bacterium]